MAQFDPYHRWLGIPPNEQPANHYRLLGLVPFEADPEVIRDAAERQMGHVRRYGLGKHLELSQKVLNELGAAKACLANAAQKAEYDTRLKEALAATAAITTPPPIPSEPRRRSAPWKFAALAGLFLAVVLAATWWARPKDAPPPADLVLKVEPIGSQTAKVGHPWSARVRVANAEAWGDNIEFRFSEKAPDGATIDESTGEIHWTPGAPGQVTIVIDVLARDGKQCDIASFTIDVHAVATKLAPLSEPFVDEERAWHLNVAGDAAAAGDGTWAFRLGPGAPPGAQIDARTGRFTWTPAEDQGPGTYPLTIIVEPPGQPAQPLSLTVHVREVNRAPTIAPVDPQEAVVGQELSIVIRADDPDLPANKLTFRLLEGPAGARLTPDTERACRFRWTPPATAAGRSQTVRVAVRDDDASPAEGTLSTDIAVRSPAAVAPPPPPTMVSTAASEDAVGTRLNEFRALYAKMQPAFVEWLPAWKAANECRQRLLALQNETQLLNNQLRTLQFNVQQWEARLPGAMQGGNTLAGLAQTLQANINQGNMAIGNCEAKIQLNQTAAFTLTTELANHAQLGDAAARKIEEVTPAWCALCDPFGRLSRPCHQASVEQLSTWIEAQPEFGLLYLARGFGAMRLEKFDTAIDDFTRFGNLGQGAAARPVSAAALCLAMIKKNDLRKARTLMTASQRVGENLPLTNLAAGYLALAEKKHPDAVRRFQAAIRLTENATPDVHAEALQALALTLAASFNSGVRDGQKAISLANKACELTAWKSWSAVDTLAAASAETGDFAGAVRRAKQAIELAPEDLRKELQQRLDAYEAKRPRRL